MKKLLALFLVTSMLCTLTACQSNDEPLDESTENWTEDWDESTEDDTEEPEASLTHAGNWFIQGISDSYCICLKNDYTWELRYPGADGEVRYFGTTKEVTDPFGDTSYDLKLDNQELLLGTLYVKENGLSMGVSFDAPYTFDGFCEYFFYSEEYSVPRFLAGNYTGWWYFSNFSTAGRNALEITDDGKWKMTDSWDAETSGTYKITDDGIVLTIEVSNDSFFMSGDVLEFTIQDDGTLSNLLYDLAITPSHDKPL